MTDRDQRDDLHDAVGEKTAPEDRCSPPPGRRGGAAVAETMDMAAGDAGIRGMRQDEKRPRRVTRIGRASHSRPLPSAAARDRHRLRGDVGSLTEVPSGPAMIVLDVVATHDQEG